MSLISIATHNLHGFNGSGSYHKSCLEKHQGIWMGQELWLQEKHLSKLSFLETEFTARSGMEEKVSSGILRGRLLVA
jgi:hypothetical protein